MHSEDLRLQLCWGGTQPKPPPPARLLGSASKPQSCRRSANRRHLDGYFGQHRTSGKLRGDADAPARGAGRAQQGAHSHSPGPEQAPGTPRVRDQPGRTASARTFGLPDLAEARMRTPRDCWPHEIARERRHLAVHRQSTSGQEAWPVHGWWAGTGGGGDSSFWGTSSSCSSTIRQLCRDGLDGMNEQKGAAGI